MSQKWPKTYLTYDVTHKKPESQNQTILSLQTRRLAESFESLNSSSVHLVEELLQRHVHTA